MSTSASVTMKNQEGLKLLVTAGPHAQKMVGIWLFGSAAWVFSMVVLGGLTRLTRSGLSMTDWKFTGTLPPLSDEEWLAEFEKYKQSPEYKRLVQTPKLVFVVSIFVLFAKHLCSVVSYRKILVFVTPILFLFTKPIHKYNIFFLILSRKSPLCRKG